MVKINEYINTDPKPVQVEEIRYIEETRLPKLSEITDKDGKVKLSPEFIDKLRDPNAGFRVDLTVFPAGIEEWEVLKSACMSSGCNDRELGYWRHGNCRYSYPGNIQWSTWARLKCPSCYKIADISEWRFICHGSGCTETTTGITRLSDAMIMILEDKSVSQEFVALFLRNAREMFRNK
ncbi:MAG: hypothetical protein MRERC_7c084 [Mycoplasmataceae bacterium RC_NB112A]|nr:MAG: hypothetical protein MRERC_7c084 [Mycoplasmataceae bacterium RC_NB112A]